MKLSEVILVEYKFVADDKTHRGYINANTNQLIYPSQNDTDYPHVNMIVRYQNEMGVTDEELGNIPDKEKRLASKEYRDWMYNSDAYSGKYQHLVYRRHWVRYDIRSYDWRIDFSLSGYAQDIADALSSPFIALSVKAAIDKGKNVAFSMDIVTPVSPNAKKYQEKYKSFSDSFRTMTGFGGMKRQFASKFGTTLVESTQFDPSRTGMATYDDMIKHPEYFETRKKRKFNIVDMSPDEYIDKAVEGFSRWKYTRDQVLLSRNKELVDEYAEKMLAGEKFPTLVLDYTDDSFSQEGLHRAMAAKKIKLQQIPVMIVHSV